ncbi:SirB2 family protein [Rufibacter ruber]|uniref:SirB2 family protein n=1 Tax=Rufibacter ruber TaxID=1783499 RepID=UPI000833940E|nr:SirB2 family protein [Rufibacter ruber]
MTAYFLNTHVLVVILFLVFFVLKAILLFLNKHDRLNKIRASTLMLDLVFGVLILVTGAYLIGYRAFYGSGTLPTWFLAKVVLVLAAIPVGIVGLKRHSKVLTALGLLLFLYVYGVAETKSLKMRPDTEEEATALPDRQAQTAATGQAQANHPILSQMQGTQLENTKAIYTQLCATCHGEDGQKGASGAVGLQQSSLSQADRKAVIANGRGLMPGFSATLTEQEIEALALYTTLLKK